MDRRSFLQLTATAAAVVGATQAISGCGQSSSSSAPSTKPVRVAVIGNPADVLDPGTASAPATYVALYAMYEPLVAVRNGQVRMVLAESITSSADATRWKISVKSDAQFSDGTSVTAADVLASLRRYSRSPVLGSFFTDVNLDVSRTIGDRQLEVVMRRPRADLVESVLTQASLVLKSGDPTRATGSGPFRLAGGDAAQGWTMRRVRGTGLVPAIEIRPLAAPDARLNALLGGQADLGFDISPTAARQVGSRPGLTVMRSGPASAKAFGVVLNTRVAPFRDPDLRLAAKLAVDRNALVKTVFQGYGTVGADVLGLSLPTYPGGLEPPARDLARASELFARAKVNSLELVVAEVTVGLSAAAELMVTQFAEAGVTLKLSSRDPGSFYADMTSLARLPMFTTYYANRTTSSALPFMTGSAGFFNLSGFGDPNYDAQLVAIAREVDPTNRQRLIDRTARIAGSQGGDLIWGFQDVIVGRAAALQGVINDAAAPDLGMARWT